MFDCDPEKFINRDKEIAIVMKRVSDLAKGNPFSPKERAFHFIGSSGIGKSSLLEKICLELTNKHPKSVFLLVRLDALVGGKREFVDELLGVAHDKFCGCQNWVLKRNDRQEFSTHIQNKISESGETIILLLDEVNVPPQKAMREIEVHLLVKFIHDNARAILITAGRSQPVTFDDFALRPNANNIFPLSAFDVDKTSQQIESLKPGAGGLARKVVKLGSGVPGNTVKLVAHVGGAPLDIPEVLAVQSLVNDIKKTNHIEDRFFPMLEALCILPGFFPEDAVPLFQGHPQLGAVWNEGRVKDIFLELNQIQIGPGGLVDWERDKKHWALDESVRGLFERELQMRDPDLWRKLHCAALEMYQEWGREYDSDMYRTKATYHQQCLQLAGLNCTKQEG